MEIRLRNEEAINSARNRIYSLKVFLVTSYFSDVEHSSGYLRFICFWTDLVRVLATTGNTCAVAGYTRVLIHENSRVSIPEKLHHCQRSKKWFTWYVILIIAENKPHLHHKTILYNESLQHATIAVLLIKILFFNHLVVFTCSKVINAFKR